MTSCAVLKPRRENSVLQGHPWIFSGAVDRYEGVPVEGEVVEVRSSLGVTLGQGHYAPTGIAVKMLTRGNEEVGEAFFRSRILDARARRCRLGLPSEETDAYRLVNAEGDGLPGLVVDVYGTAVVIQTHTVGMSGAASLIAAALVAALGDGVDTIFHMTPSGEGGSYLLGSRGEGVIQEHRNRFVVDWEGGQKTGFFLDQRENRHLLGTIAQGQRILNTFCFTGGFSIYAATAGAASVVSVDSSKAALALLDRTLELHSVTTHCESVAADCFDYLERSNERFDIVVVDPPAFAKHVKGVASALRGYERIHTLAVRRVRPGGLLMTFSCSGVIGRDDFRQAVARGIAAARRSGGITHHLSAAPCHPVAVGHPEGEYLKGLLIEVA